MLFWIESKRQVELISEVFDNADNDTHSVLNSVGFVKEDFFASNRDATDISSPYPIGASSVNGSSGDRFYSFVFETGSDVTTEQVVFEHGGGTNGFCLGITSGELRAHYYQNETSSPYLSMNVNPNTTYLISTEYLSGTQKLWENDVIVDTISKDLSAGFNKNGFGGVNSSSLFPGGAVITSSGKPFLGDIGAAVCFVQTLTNQEKTDILNYLSENYLGSSIT
jgi:hypothetical protein